MASNVDEKRRKHAEYMRTYYQNNPEVRKISSERAKKYRQEHPEKRKAWRENNKEYLKEYSKLQTKRARERRLTMDGRLRELPQKCNQFDKTYNRISPNPITIEAINDMYTKQKGLCYYTGVKLKAETGIYQISVDRLDSSIGHSIENCVLTTLPINRFKGVMTVEEFNTLINNITLHVDIPYTPPNYEELSKIAKTKISNLVGDIKRRAKKANHACEMSVEVFKEWRIKQGDRCNITKVPICWETYQWNTGSIDRIDSSKGYTLDNIQIVLWSINMMKNDLTHDEAIEVMNYAKNGLQKIKS
jgi:hypothetical protein